MRGHQLFYLGGFILVFLWLSVAPGTGFADDALPTEDGKWVIINQPMIATGTGEIPTAHETSAPKLEVQATEAAKSPVVQVGAVAAVSPASGPGLQIDSTEGGNLSPEKPADAAEDKVDPVLQKQQWRHAAETALEQTSQSKSSDAEHAPLNVRMSYLPNAPTSQKIQPPQPRSGAAENSSASKPAVVAPKAVAECAAIDSYRKKQLEAIKGDHKTLEALQAAISDLGLQKQLNFMTGMEQGSATNAAPVVHGAAKTATP